ncbi:hypothetical protein [Priestia megaterium]|uniref:hypothetical protein n=1 Tax=Priestia megaterium TaxID=1404 RepID=UPI00317A7707
MSDYKQGVLQGKAGTIARLLVYLTQANKEVLHGVEEIEESKYQQELISFYIDTIAEAYTDLVLNIEDEKVIDKIIDETLDIEAESGVLLRLLNSIKKNAC